jgi:hypothetical protein
MTRKVSIAAACVLAWLAATIAALAQAPIAMPDTGPMPMRAFVDSDLNPALARIGSDTQRAVTAAYTVGQSGDDCGIRITAGGGAFYAISQSGSYAAGCKVGITNTDPIPTGSNATGAKFVDFVKCNPSLTGTYLWPQQTMEVTRIGGAWVPTHCPGLFEMPTGNFVFNVDPTNGSDTWGSADGLGLTTRAFASVANALSVAADTMAGNFIRQTTFTALLCASCTDGAVLHWPSHGGSPIGAQGGSGTIVDCNGGTLSGGVQLFFQSTLAFQNCIFTDAVSATQSAVIVLNSGGPNTFASGSFLQLSQGAQGRCGGCTINVSGTFADMFQVFATSSIMGININQTGDVTYSDVAFLVASGSFATISGWTTNGFSATGTKYRLLECGVMEGVSLIAGTVAGSSSCTQAN